MKFFKYIVFLVVHNIFTINQLVTYMFLYLSKTYITLHIFIKNILKLIYIKTNK